ncbi:MAG TPA: hypothetical protein VI389_10605 [Geobacteraceae bacterium]
MPERVLTDRELWERGVAVVSKEYAALAPDRRDALLATIRAIKAAKEELHRLADKVDCGGLCATCGGACCATGKYHFTVVDLLVLLACGEDLFSPRFEGGRCPYLADSRCLMAPPFRPFNCITFICDMVESRLQPEDRELCLRHEKELRSGYAEVETLFAGRFMHGLLINSERYVKGVRAGILGGA